MGKNEVSGIIIGKLNFFDLAPNSYIMFYRRQDLVTTEKTLYKTWLLQQEDLFLERKDPI